MRESFLPHLQHDTAYHAKMLEERRNPKSVCCITGFSQHTLAKLNETLSVDRIDPNVGYVPGNCQLMANCLNTAKGSSDRVPPSAINRLIRKVQRVCRSRHDDPETLQN